MFVGRENDLADLMALWRKRTSSRTVVFLDEISWMGHYDPSFAALLKNAWDLRFSKRANLVLVLAGSVSAWIQENILILKW